MKKILLLSLLALPLLGMNDKQTELDILKAALQFKDQSTILDKQKWNWKHIGLGAGAILAGAAYWKWGQGLQDKASDWLLNGFKKTITCTLAYTPAFIKNRTLQDAITLGAIYKGSTAIYAGMNAESIKLAQGKNTILDEFIKNNKIAYAYPLTAIYRIKRAIYTRHQ